MPSPRVTVAHEKVEQSHPEGISVRPISAAAHPDRDGVVGVSSARRERARGMDAIHRALSSSGGSFSDRSRSARSDFGAGGGERPLFLSAAFDRFPARAGYVCRNHGGNSWLVFGTQWRIFWPAGYTALVGRNSADILLLAVLGAEDQTQPSRPDIRNHPRDARCAGRVDGIPRWTIGARRG